MKLEPLEIPQEMKVPLREKEEKKKKKKKKKELEGVWDSPFNKKKLKKPTYVAVIYLRNNGKADRLEAETKHGFFQINDKTYHEDRDCIFRLKEGYPLAIIPEWSLIPYGTARWHDKTMLEKFAELQDHALRGIRHAELVKMGERDKPKISGKAIVGLIILGIIGLVLLQSYI